MKRFSVISTIVVLSMLLMGTFPASASPGAVNRNSHINATVQSNQGTSANLADILNTLPEAHHDAFDGLQNQFFCSAVGWAVDPDGPSQGLNIRVFSDGIQVAETVADTFRQDLADGGVCAGGSCSFSVNLWKIISPDVDHLITVQAQDAQTGEWVNAFEPPKTLKCSEENVLPEGSHDAAEGVQNQLSCMAEGWAADPNDRSIHLNVRVLSDDVEVAQTVADTYRPDLADAGVCTDGACSFSVSLWGLITPDVDHLIAVQAQDAQNGEWVDLGNIPKTLNCFEVHAQTFIVNSIGDSGDVLQGNGVCETSTPGECTLRAAIMESNANSGADTIHFDIPGPGPYTISPSYGFDFISDPVTIDATTQPGFSGTPFVELDGSNAGSDAYGIVIFAGSSTVRGLAINRFALTGVDINVNGGNTIQGNYIGTDLTGTVDLGNGVHGIAIQTGSGSNLIGGTTPGAGNLISGNNELGIIVVNPGSDANVIQGNFIGTDVTGTVKLGNHIIGIVIGDGASNNIIGGEESGSRNIISGNDGHGIQIDTISSTGNLVQGNYIGTDVTGTLPLGNSDDGVLLLAPNNIIGGTTTAARNIISGNQEQGIQIAGSEATGNVIQGNFIGTDVTGVAALGNGTDCCHSGIVISAGASHNTIGGNAPGAGNVISGNTADGVTVYDVGTTGNLIQGNHIGTDLSGTLALGNTFEGIVIGGGASDNLIGGTTTQARNIIAGNGRNGIGIYDAGTTGNIVQGNFIGTNVNGTLAMGNSSDGISICCGAAANVIGGTVAGAGNLISGNSEHGVVIYGEGISSNTVQGNYIGTDVSGTFALGNTFDGVIIGGGASDNLVGGTTTQAGNIISGNNGNGVTIVDASSTGNLVQGNHIGTNVTGTLSLGNVYDGVFIGGGASNSVIGGTALGAGNLISGNNGNGVTIVDASSTGNLVQGNHIGTDVTGILSLGNANDGVLLGAPNNTIGGTTMAARNLISGNQEQGIRIAGSEATGNAVQGNFIGTDVTGSVALSNGTDCCHSGVVIHLGASNNTIGGSVPGARNVISGNTFDGVTIMDAGTNGNLVAGNFIGTDLTGTKNVANSFSGIDIYDGASNNMIGGTTSGAGNTIAFNNTNGVVLAMSGGAHNGILSNSIHSNGNLGIDLGDDGVTGIDLFDADSGPNNLQNFPLLNTVKSTSKGTLIQGALLSTRNTTFRLEFFSSNSCDPSGYGEGQTYLGFVNVTTNSTGHVNFNITLPTSLTKGSFITATATDPAKNTSEFSQCVKAAP